MSQQSSPQDTGISHDRICVEKVANQKELDHIHNPTHSTEAAQHLRAAFVKTKLWPQKAKVTIAFTSPDKPAIPKTGESALKQVSDGGSIDPLQKSITDTTNIKAKIKQIVKDRIQPLVNLDLVFVENPADAKVRISFDPTGGSWSLVGTDCLKQKTGATMNFGWFDVGTVMHEFGHMLGMIHEHQNPRGDIQWDDDAVYEWAAKTQGWDKQTTRTNIINRYKLDSINGSSFDALSIMLYFFPDSLTTDHKGTHQNLTLSGPDVTWINKMYPTENYDAAAQFYDNVYSMPLSQAMAESEKASKGEGGTKDSTKIIIGLSVTLGVVVLGIIGFLVYKYFAKREPGRRRRY
jgi:hypothetical protein